MLPELISKYLSSESMKSANGLMATSLLMEATLSSTWSRASTYLPPMNTRKQLSVETLSCCWVRFSSGSRSRVNVGISRPAAPKLTVKQFSPLLLGWSGDFHFMYNSTNFTAFSAMTLLGLELIKHYLKLTKCLTLSPPLLSEL